MCAVIILAAITILLSVYLWTYIYLFQRKDYLDVSHPLPNRIQILRTLLVALGDSHLIIALSIVLSSLLTLKSSTNTPLYHTFIARSLADIALIGHAAAIVHVHPTQLDWGSRLVFVSATMLMWQWWSWLALDSFRRSTRAGEHCFENTNGLPGNYTT